ncbi:DNA repair protein [Gammaproteobacteria bacterium 45_16_T64]|nr:DNA repair protein [Gammaproteobacteria bacterium 45_16_T64]
MSGPDSSVDIVDNAVAEGGAYEIIRKRLIEQGRQLNQKTQSLNEARVAEFGGSDMEVVGRVRVRTENNCIARDIVQVSDHLLFGYNVFIGLKKETKIEDVFALFDLQETEAGHEMVPVSLEGTFLTEASFVSDFDELYRYYKHTKLVELTIKDGKLLAGFQIGERIEDIRVFRWAVSSDGSEVSYIDNRGERDIQLPPSYDFEWLETTRDDTVHGRHSHVNILDSVFVETIGGDLTVKIEDNTEDGLGIHSEPVDDKTQSIDDADIYYASVGQLVLLKVRPYREEQWRYLVFNRLTETVLRIDAIGLSCVQLPEDHGIIFPGGFYLQSGEYKTFDEEHDGLTFKRMIRSPNGEDVLYVFYEPEEGVVGLFGYNLIDKELQNPIYGHGYALAEDGTVIIFSSEEEATRIHPMQIWNTPYASAEFASQAPESQTFYGKVGNAELVRGVSDLYSLCRLIGNQSVSVTLYEELSKSAARMFDAHYWIENDELEGVDDLLKEISSTSELVIDEFEKVQSIRMQSQKTMAEAEREQTALVQSIRPESWQTAEEYVGALSSLRKQRGHLVTIKDHRYIDTKRIVELETQLTETEGALSDKTVTFLTGDEALSPYWEKIESINHDVAAANTIAELTPLIELVEATASGLDLLSELMGTLKVDDATIRTRIIDTISQVYSRLNQSKAQAKIKQKELGSSEAIAQFGAQFKLFSQSITNALGLSTTPERCDEQLARLLVQLEELESQFSEFDQFLSDIMDKREEIYESFESHRQKLLDERQRKAQSVADAGARILSSIEKRSLKFTESDELNTYFASDALVLKIRELVERLRELEAAIKADDIESKFKSIKEQALRSLRDKTDIYEDGGNVIKLGPRHKFSVNTQELDLTIIPRDGLLNVHLTGTNYFEPIENQLLLDLKQYWDMALESETPEVYRGEFLAALILGAAESGESDLSLDGLATAINSDELKDIVRDFASPRYKEGYEKGIHDHDATLILSQLVPALATADLLCYDPLSRGLAQVFWSALEQDAIGHSSIKLSSQQPDEVDPAWQCWFSKKDSWPQRAQSAKQMREVFTSTEAATQLASEIRLSLQCFLEVYPISVTSLDVTRAAEYLVEELGRGSLAFVQSKYSQALLEELQRSLSTSAWQQFQSSLDKLRQSPHQRWELCQSWLEALIKSKSLDRFSHYVPETIALINAGNVIRRVLDVDLELTINGLLGEHRLISGQALAFSLDSFRLRLEHHQQQVIPAYQQYLNTRQDIIVEERRKLRLEEFKARPLSSFVRNRLINESYLPLIGDNLAKQMGTVGEDKRSDLMGLLMMISPPGYGKTTLMEYVANRLGLIFMKINCPSLGHDVMSLDPEQAPNATAAQELLKLNLALEMGNNVMLYLDDIQHTHPEFLQKFISLCDGTRRIEGIWKGNTKTYDMRGRKFCVVMAGNPYTESGEAFTIPDMLANRADIYNLGDILGGMDEQFALSYIENALTSNAVLAPLAVREMSDVYQLIDMAKGINVANTDLGHAYSGAEINEITEILRKMMVIQDVILKINQQYIASAAQNDLYRTEPSFKLQGSYRNMNKMTEKVSAVMNEQELMQMIEDHYLGEAQLLTNGAEDNLLKLAELRGNMTDEQAERWQQIKRDFLRNKAMGGDDVGGKVIAQLVDLVDGVQSLGNAAAVGAEQRDEQHKTLVAYRKAELQQQKLQQQQQQEQPDWQLLSEQLTVRMESLVGAIAENTPSVQVVNQPVPGMDKVLSVLADTIEHSIFPLVRSMDKKLDIDLRTHDKMKEITGQLRALEDYVAKQGD